jgi:hypothetical protein
LLKSGVRGEDFSFYSTSKDVADVDVFESNFSFPFWVSLLDVQEKDRFEFTWESETVLARRNFAAAAIPISFVRGFEYAGDGAGGPYISHGIFLLLRQNVCDACKARGE